MLSAENNQTWTKNFLRKRNAIQRTENCTLRKCNAIWLRNCTSYDGPFYCPADETVYMDMSFFGEMQQKFGARVTEFTVAMF